MASNPAMLFGRRTFEDFESVWPNQKDGNPFTEMLNNAQKYVASKTLKEPLSWQNSTLLEGDATDAVAKLKKGDRDIVVLGSGKLVTSLMAANLIDRYVLLIHPLVLGSGQRLFNDTDGAAPLHLVDSKTSTTGVVIATYEPAEKTA